MVVGESDNLATPHSLCVQALDQNANNVLIQQKPLRKQLSGERLDDRRPSLKSNKRKVVGCCNVNESQMVGCVILLYPTLPTWNHIQMTPNEYYSRR